jgi:two-component system, cell cycle response regulator
MGLRARLAAFFVVITVIPLTVAVIVLQIQIDQRLASRAGEELITVRQQALGAVDAARADAAALADRLVEEGAPEAVTGSRDAQPWLDEVLGDDRPAGFALVFDAEGALVAGARSAPRFALPGVAVPASPDVLPVARDRGDPPAGVLTEVREMRGAAPGEPQRLLGWVVAGTWLDGALLDAAPPAGHMAILAGDVVLAATVPPEQVPVDAASAVESTRTVRVDGERVLASATAAGPGTAPTTRVLTWVPHVGGGTPVRTALLILLPATLLAGGIGWLLAGAVVAPVREAAETARAVAGGDLTRVLQPTGGRELEDLARSLNVMSAELAARLEEIERSRDQLRGSLSRLGRTLSSSLDLDRMLAVVVETAMDTLRAERAGLYLFTPERDALYVKVGRGLGRRPSRLVFGEGVIGFSAHIERPIRLPADEDVPMPVEGEPVGAQQLVVPLAGRGRALGVLTLIRDDLTAPFSGQDLETLRSFGAQASVAIENVLLHQEAQRLSVTDNLTGLWNFRYFQIQADRELESAERFERPVSLVIVDIDHFKDVNDHYGHQVGDEALIEVARRIHDATRTPDVVARYGGEEFVVLLPGTDHDGALATAERIRAAVAASPVLVTSGMRSDGGIGELSITCSAGVAAFPEHGRSVATLLRAADAAMYRAKTLGRNRVLGAEDREPRPVAPVHGEAADPA